MSWSTGCAATSSPATSGPSTRTSRTCAANSVTMTRRSCRRYSVLATSSGSAVITDRRGSLQLRLLAAFSAVAAVSVVLLTIAALIGTDQGVNAAQDADRRQAAQRAATAVARAYQQAGGWG